ncbi:hypothetical protein ACA910_000983 [Epithemia clementina (nom. ined.)]
MHCLHATFEAHNLDTVTYLQDPADATIMRNIVIEHMRFTFNNAATLAQTQKALYNQYDHANHKAAIQALLKSLDPTLANDIEDRMNSSMTLHQVWMLLICNLQTDSINKFDKLKNKIRSHTPFLNDGQNIAEMARHCCNALQAVGFHEQTLKLTILESFMLATGSDFYKLGLHSLHAPLTLKIPAIAYNSKGDQQKEMLKAGLSYHDVCNLAKKLYPADISQNRWSPALNNADSKVPTDIFGKLSDVQAMVLQQYMTAKHGNCYIYDKPDHMACNCPNQKSHPRPTHPSQPPNSCQPFQGCGGCSHSNHSNNCGCSAPPTNKNTNHHRSSSQHSNCSGHGNSPHRNLNNNTHNWCNIAPTDNVTTKTVDGACFHWCTKCKRWMSHSTEQHCSRTPSNPNVHTMICHDAAAWAARLNSAQLNDQIPTDFWDNFETAPLHDESDDMEVLFASEHDHPQEVSEFSLLHNTVSTPANVEANITFTTDISTIGPTSVADLKVWANATALDAKLEALVPFFNDLNTFDTMDTNDKFLQDVKPPMDIVAEPVASITNPDPDPFFHPDDNASASNNDNDPDLALPLLVGQLRVHDEDMYLEDNDAENASVDLLCSVNG